MTGGQASGFVEQKSEGPLDGEEHEDNIADADQENVKTGKTTSGIDQGDGQGEQNPANDIITDTSSENYETDNGIQQLQLCENAAKHGESGDSNGDSDKEDEVGHVDRIRDEGVIKWDSDGGSETEWYNKPQDGNKGGRFAIPFYETDIDLETNEE